MEDAMGGIDRTASTTRRTAVRARVAAVLRRAAATVVAAGALLAAPAAHAQVDSWTGQDKLKHFGVSAQLGALGMSMIPARASTTERILYGTLIGSLPGLAKELADFGGRGTPSMRDMAFNLLGAAVGAAFADCCMVRPIARGDRIDGVGIEYRIQF
jgi:putative lipoprotein